MHPFYEHRLAVLIIMSNANTSHYTSLQGKQKEYEREMHFWFVQIDKLVFVQIDRVLIVKNLSLTLLFPLSERKYLKK